MLLWIGLLVVDLFQSSLFPSQVGAFCEGLIWMRRVLSREGF